MSWTKRELKQSFRCHGSQIKQLRKRKGWSQEQLVEASGYSIRLISKAESSGRIALNTLVDLAEALGTSNKIVRPEQLIFDPVRLCRLITHATYVLQRDSFDYMKHLIADDFVLDAVGDSQQFPFVGQYHGVEGFRRALDLFYQHMEVPPNVDYTKWYRYYPNENDENQVVVWGKSWIHPIGKPLESPLDVTQRVRFRNGKLCYFENRYDAAGISKSPTCEHEFAK